jgi:hypothetical protein
LLNPEIKKKELSSEKHKKRIFAPKDLPGMPEAIKLAKKMGESME